MKVARARVKELLERIPHVTFAVPSGVDVDSVTFDGREVPKDALTKKFSVDPGSHVVAGSGRRNGAPARFRQDATVKEKDFLTFTIDLR